jgi:hypothetical protein
MLLPSVLPPRSGVGPTRLADRGVAGGEFVRLGDTWFRTYPFETRRCGEGRACPPRTVGCVGLLWAGGHGLDGVGAREAAELCLRGCPMPAPAEAARDKVVVCSRRGQTAVYQADRPNRCAALCACGNATAAGAALLAHCLGRYRPRQPLRLPDGQVEMRSRVVRAGTGWHVDQVWDGIRLQVQPVRLRSREAAVCTGSFNDYLVVLLPGAAELAQLGLEEVLDLWHEARRFAAFENPLQSRLAAIAPHGTRPYVRFYTCGRAHPGAPLTGLATLALAASRLGWLAGLLEGGAIEHRRGVDALPAVEPGAGGQAIRFPAVDVVLQRV